MTSAATAPERHLIRRARASVVLGAAAVALALATPGGGTAGAQLIPETTESVPETTEAPPETTAPVPETTEAPTTAPPTTAPRTTSPPATRAPATTTAPSTTAPPETTTSAPPSAPSTIPVTTVPVEGRTRITQDTPDLGGVLTLWGLGILGTVSTLAWGWWRNRD